MHSNFYRRFRVLGLLATAALVVAATLSSAWAVDAVKDRAGEWAQHRQQWVRARLDGDANRLELKASQQAVWQDYAKARAALADRMFVKPAQDADAGAIAKIRAERAAESARKLAALADATAKLQAVLSPEQRLTLDQIAHDGRHRHGHCGWHRGPEGVHGDGYGHASDQDQNEEAPAA